MKFVGKKPNDPYEPIGQQGFSRQVANGQLGAGYSPGTIRDTLGSGLKARGIFQKDGQIQNSRGGFIGAKQAPLPGIPWQAPLPPQSNQGGYPQVQGYPQGGYEQRQEYAQIQGYSQYTQGQSRQLILQAAQQGINGNGVATISPDNSFILIVNLPPPQTFLGQGQTGMYATYLVDDKGKTGFLAGILRPVGNGVYRAHFQSQVPLHHYSRVVVSVENPAQLGQAPNGPIILKVKDPMGVMTFLNPMKTTATSIWGKISGLISGGKKPAISPEPAPISQELLQSLNQMGVVPDPGIMAPPSVDPPMGPPISPPTGPN